MGSAGGGGGGGKEAREDPAPGEPTPGGAMQQPEEERGECVVCIRFSVKNVSICALDYLMNRHNSVGEV